MQGRTLLLISGLKDPAHFGKAIRNIIPMYADSMSKSTLVSAFEKEQAMQAKALKTYSRRRTLI